MAVIDVNRLEAKSGEYSDNKHIVRREDLKVSLVSVRPKEEIPVHLHEAEEQFYYVLEGEGLLSLGDGVYELRPGIAVVIPPQLPHGVSNPNATHLRYLDFFVVRGS